MSFREAPLHFKAFYRLCYDFELEEEIESGDFGIIVQARSFSTNEPLICKFFSRPKGIKRPYTFNTIQQDYKVFYSRNHIIIVMKASENQESNKEIISEIKSLSVEEPIKKEESKTRIYPFIIKNKEPKKLATTLRLYKQMHRREARFPKNWGTREIQEYFHRLEASNCIKMKPLTSSQFHHMTNSDNKRKIRRHYYM